MSETAQETKPTTADTQAMTPEETQSVKAQPSPESSAASDFARRAEEKPPGLVAEFVDFLIHNKKWWLTPIILVLLLLGLLAFFSSGPAAPFIYQMW